MQNGRVFRFETADAIAQCCVLFCQRVIPFLQRIKALEDNVIRLCRYAARNEDTRDGEQYGCEQILHDIPLTQTLSVNTLSSRKYQDNQRVHRKSGGREMSALGH